MPTDTSVKFFRDSMSGAPQSNGDPGTFIPILDACLVTGFGSVTLNSLVVSSNVATATTSAAHSFGMTGATGPVILIEGATPSALNGEWRIQTVPTTTSFTFTTSGISDQTATGTITAKRAPAGFEKVFSATNIGVYRSMDIQGTQAYLRIDDTADWTGNAASAALRMFSAMTDVNTGTNGSTTLYCARKSANTTTTRSWRVIADARAFYLIVESNAGGTSYPGRGAAFFGDLAAPAVVADTGHCALAGWATATTSNTSTATLARMDEETTGRLLLNYTNLTANVAMRRRAHLANSGTVSNGGGSYTAEIGVLVKAVEAWEGSSYYRGLMPGWYGQVHPNLSNWAWSVYEHPQIGTLWGDYIYTNGDSHQFFDITGPWR